MRIKLRRFYILAGVIGFSCLMGWFFYPRPIEVKVTTRLLMGTLIAISTWSVPEGEESRIVGLAFEEMARIEGLMSRFQPESMVAMVNRSQRGEEVEISAELGQIVSKGMALHRLSGGAFDIGLGPLSDLWGFSREPPPNLLPPSKSLADWVRQHASVTGGGMTLSEDPKWRIRLHHATVGLDLGGIAKGYAVDQAMEVLRREGVKNALINAGGDMRVMGSKGGIPWHIGLRDPRDPSGVVAVLDLAGGIALSTSGDYERFFMVDGIRYHHILDPRTGQPARSGLISVSIQAKDSLTADGLSTAVLVLGEQAGVALLRHFPGCEALWIREDGSYGMTPGFIGRWIKSP